MCAGHDATLVLPSDRACPGCLNRVLAARVDALSGVLGALVDAETEAAKLACGEDQEAMTEAVSDVYGAVDRAVDILADRTWLAPAFHADSPVLN